MKALLLLLLLLLPIVSKAQQTEPAGNMANMKMSGEDAMAPPETFIQAITHHGNSGTSAEPNSTPLPMLMTQKAGWMLMFHANIFLTDTQQSSARGFDKF